jgi:hypothetical protein
VGHRGDVRRRKASYFFPCKAKMQLPAQEPAEAVKMLFLGVEDYSSRVCDDVRGGAAPDAVLTLAQRPPFAARKGRLARIHAPAGARASRSGEFALAQW